MSQVVEDPQPLELSQSLAVATSESARQKRKIAALEEKLQVLESGHAVKLRQVQLVYMSIPGFSLSHVMIDRETNYYMSKGRAIRRIVTLFDTIEDLISENDRRCDLDNEDNDVTLE